MATKSNYGTVNVKDFGKGLIYTVFTSVLVAGQQLLDKGLSLDNIPYKTLGSIAVAALVGYLLKNLGTNSQDQFLKKEPTKPVSDTIKSTLKTILVLVGFTLLSSCTPQKKVATTQKIQAYTTQALEITNKIWAIVNSPAVDAATIITPAQWDDKAKDKIRAYLAEIRPYLGIMDNCNSGSLEDEFKCIIDGLKHQPELQRNENIQKLLAFLTVAQNMYL